jgi:DNA end-binding protein Ku
MHKDCGTRLKQQYICPIHGTIVERTDMVKGYEFEKDKMCDL